MIIAGGWGASTMLGQVAETVGLYLVLCIIQSVLLRGRLFKSISGLLNLAFLTFAILLFLGPWLESIHVNLYYGVMAAFVFFCVTILLRVVDVLLFDHLFQWRGLKPVPVVLRDIGRWIVTISALFLIIRVMFPYANLNVIALSSIVVGYIVGNATQETLGNLISGLALNTERPFEIGDWVMINNNTGKVVDMTWRATRLQTKMEDYVIIPNGAISRDPIVNFSRPTPLHAQKFKVGTSYDAPPKRVRAVIRQALAAVPEIMTDPAPRIYLTGYGDFAIEYTVKYYIRDFERIEIIESDALDLIWYYFRREGIAIPFPIRDVRMTAVTVESRAAELAESRRETAATLSRIDIFSGLDAASLDHLVARVHEQIFAAGEALVRQGDEGDSLYLIRDGRVAVTVRGDDGLETDVARLGPGAFFGEFSLLIGAKRTATVRAEIDTVILRVDKESMAEVLRLNVNVADQLALVLEQRTSDRQAKLAATRESANSGAAHSGGGELLQRIRAFFGIGRA